ncbi:MAG: hypothetical protein RIQ93_2647 [Verrucomicrobiota bacterium]|jgi:septal ring factor EnvC (AmiA/AmiB activator)
MLAGGDESRTLSGTMLRRPLLILCTIALGGAGLFAALYYRANTANARMGQLLDHETRRSAKLADELTTAKAESSAMTVKVSFLETELSGSRTKLATVEARATQLDRDLLQAKDALSVHELNARALAGELATLRNELASRRAAETSPEAVAAYKATIADLERQLAVAGNGVAAPNVAGASTAVFTSRVTRATVLTVGPSNSFVVLNFGTRRGAKVGQQLDVSQGGLPVATVALSDVRSDFSIGQVLPASLRTSLQKGNLAVLRP